MRMDIFLNLQGCITSLIMSTMRVIATALITIKINGLCSEYISHQSIEFEKGHGHKGLVHVSNTRYDLIIGGTEETRREVMKKIQEENDLFLELVECEIPTSELVDLFTVNGQNPSGVRPNSRENPITTVYLPRPVLVGWDDGKRPIFEKNPVVADPDGWFFDDVAGYDVRWQEEGHKEVNLQMKVWGRWEPVYEVEYDGYELVIIGEGGKTLYEDEPCTSGLKAVREFLYDDGLMRFAGVCYSLRLTQAEERENWVVLDDVDHPIHDVDLILTPAGDILVEDTKGDFHTFDRFDSVDGLKVIVPKLGDPIAIPQECFHEMAQWVMERTDD